MLFYSHVFLLAFLPLTLLTYYALAHFGRTTAAKAWLVLASLFFYTWWNPKYLILLLISMSVNYVFGKRLLTGSSSSPSRAPSRRRLILICGLIFNLGSLGYFKYAGFLVKNYDWILGQKVAIPNIILPLGISFFTFQKIAFLVDAYKRKVEHLSFLNYCLFVTFFPQLIAGPIVHHAEIMPQFDDRNAIRYSAHDFAIGVSLFSCGLFKKLVFADWAAKIADPVFDSARAARPDCVASWLAAFAYTAQIYYDFSGYSDMALGLARMFNIRLPLNFFSPYQADSISEFWRRWHMSLSRFLRDYLYIPLGGNRKGVVRQNANLMTTMALGGLWHGAQWHFVLWGVLHGIYLIVNHLWRASPLALKRAGVTGEVLGRILTFSFVLIAWVLFRAADLKPAMKFYSAMAHFQSTAWQWPSSETLVNSGGLLFLFLLAFFAPNTMSIFAMDNSKSGIFPIQSVRWKPTLGWAVGVGALFFVSSLFMNQVESFIYFQF